MIRGLGGFGHFELLVRGDRFEGRLGGCGCWNLGRMALGRGKFEDK